MRRDEGLRRSMPVSPRRQSGHSSSPPGRSIDSRRPVTVDAGRSAGRESPALPSASPPRYSQYTDVSAKYGGGSASRSPVRSSDSLLGPMQHQSPGSVQRSAHHVGGIQSSSRHLQAASAESMSAKSGYQRKQPQSLSVPNRRSSTELDNSKLRSSHTGGGASGYLHERTTPSSQNLSERAHSMPSSSPVVSPGPSSPTGRVRKMADIPKSLSLAAPGLAAMIRDQVIEGVKEVEKAAYMDPKLTSANNTLVLPPFTDMTPAVRSYLYWRLLDVDRLKALQVSDQDDFIRITFPAKSTLTAVLPLTSMGDGNCCLHAVSLALWGIQDRVGTLRNALLEMTKRQEDLFKKCWRQQELEWDAADARLMGQEAPIERSKEEWEKEWSDLVQRAGTDYAYLAQIHLFILSHVIRRPIIVYAPTEQQDSPCRFRGVYLPVGWQDPEECEKAPILLAYDSSHFVPLTYHLSAWPPQTRKEWPLIPLEVEGALLPAPFSKLMAPRNWTGRRLYQEYLAAEEEETEGTLAVRMDLRERCAEASKRLGKRITEFNSHVGQLINVFLEEGRAEAIAEVKRTPILTRQDSALARSLQQEEFDRHVSRPFANLSFN